MKTYKCLIVLTLLISSCFIKPNKNPVNLWSENKIDTFIVDWMIENDKGVFDWSVTPDIMLYSALMHGDSMLYIDYKLEPNGPNTIIYNSTDTLRMPDKWIERRDKLINYILEEEQEYRKQPDLTINDLLPWWNKEITSDFPNLTLKVTSPNIISTLRRDETIVLIQPGYYHKNHTIMQLLIERRKKNRESSN